MATIVNRVMNALDQKDIMYRVIEHREDFTAQETAEDTFTPGDQFAKAVVLEADGELLMAVVAAPEHVDLRKIGMALNATDVALINEDRMLDLFPDCEIGAEPPFGNLYDMPVYVSPTIADDDYITFNGGSHIHVLRMRYQDYEMLVKPQVIDMVLDN
jgi:Ala-tRNA(Pro) deacylase